MEGDILNGGDQVERSNQKEKDLFIYYFAVCFTAGEGRRARGYVWRF